ncbi:MAG: hypothetical protein OH319_04450 [Candidatus Parvarchaeota archaeon]|nr:hypothetical protein [Candidatus Jingweiarchaeum tengchongense]MCW1297912.1 hypothetical protein [Candidatus Jingweiarchaeum tengchongense]MCW1300655.1 hypothetical protein [Candidatus Jingweiarchaeum tengchongense]MCW1304649.1 hypothetical protein [Candidatus Jingweiarchaeum tengchongense]MCW1306042.1 hypothetical protein [Candidatus Jingweiarchaeum tengchongense]
MSIKKFNSEIERMEKIAEELSKESSDLVISIKNASAALRKGKYSIVYEWISKIYALAEEFDELQDKVIKMILIKTCNYDEKLATFAYSTFSLRNYGNRLIA